MTICTIEYLERQNGKENRAEYLARQNVKESHRIPSETEYQQVPQNTYHIRLLNDHLASFRRRHQWQFHSLLFFRFHYRTFRCFLIKEKISVDNIQKSDIQQIFYFYLTEMQCTVHSRHIWQKSKNSGSKDKKLQYIWPTYPSRNGL